MSETIYPENTIARATVRGVPDVLVLRRCCFRTSEGWHMDWAHTSTAGFTCSNDDEVTDIVVKVSKA